MNEQLAQTTPQVNMLGNLIRWVSVAKGKLGVEQLPTFLEVYGICGNLSLELKEVILHLADQVEQQPEEMASADVWSQLILELHGILAGGGTPIKPLGTLWDGEENEKATVWRLNERELFKMYFTEKLISFGVRLEEPELEEFKKNYR